MKKALLTTTALVALNSAAFASSIDTPVNSASSTHHTHSAATIVWSGDANIKYNVPLVKTTISQVDGSSSTSKAEGTVKSEFKVTNSKDNKKLLDWITNLEPKFKIYSVK